MTARVKRPKKKTGRKLLPIDPKIVAAMASVGATDTEIAEYTGAGEETIRRRFRGILLKGRAGMRLRLRQSQFKLALAGNPALNIWLGKIMLGQKETSVIETRDVAKMTPEEVEAEAKRLGLA